MYNVFVPSFPSHFRNSSAMNSGPLSERICSGIPPPHDAHPPHIFGRRIGHDAARSRRRYSGLREVGERRTRDLVRRSEPLRRPRQASWSEPFILAGTEQRNAALPVQILGAGNFAVRIQPGLRGMLDGTIQFSNGGGTLEVSGFRVHVVGDALEGARSTNKLVEVRNESANGRVAFRQRFRGWAGSFDLVCEIWPNGDAVQ